jgi:hypothetical protein
LRAHGLRGKTEGVPGTVLEHLESDTLKLEECVTEWVDTETRGTVARCKAAAKRLLRAHTADFQSIDDLEAMRKRARKMGCRKATYHEDEDAGRQQAFETSLEVSALILLCSDSVRVAMLGTCTWYEWCGELMVIRTKMGLGQYEHCKCWCRGVQTPAPVEI